MLFARMIKIWRAQKMADFMNESSAAGGIIDLRERVGPQGISPEDLRLVYLKSVYLTS